MTRTHPAEAPGWTSAIFAALAYFAASVLLTWPVIARPGKVLFGDYGDTRGWAWWVWAKAHGFLEGASTPLLAAPFGQDIQQPFSQPISEWAVIVIARLSNEIAAMNSFVVLSFPLTALATYVLLRRLGLHGAGAFFGGLAFGFCPAAVMQAAGGHAAYAFNTFIPLFVLALFHNRAHRTLRSALCVGGAFAGIAFTSIYFAYFALYVALYFLVFDYATREVGHGRQMASNYLWCALIAAVIVVPFELSAIVEQLTASRETIATAGRSRGFFELAIFAAHPWNYLVPSIDHPVLGAVFEDFVRGNLHGGNVFEQTLYLGVAPLGLLAAGIVKTTRRTLQSHHRRLFLFFAIGAGWTFFLSLPPTIAGGVPTASYFAYDFAPMFRVYARFGILVDFFVACAGAVVLTSLFQRMEAARHRAMLALLFPVLVFEYWSVPPGHALDVDRPPEVYGWLARQPGDFIVAEYPMIASDEAASYSYPFWQRIHAKRLVNGASRDNVRAWDFYEKVADLADPETPALLKAAGVKYVIVHRRMYEEGPIPTPIKRYYPVDRARLQVNGGAPPVVPPPLAFHKAFGPDAVYAVE